MENHMSSPNSEGHVRKGVTKRVLSRIAADTQRAYGDSQLKTQVEHSKAFLKYWTPKAGLFIGLGAVLGWYGTHKYEDFREQRIRTKVEESSSQASPVAIEQHDSSSSTRKESITRNMVLLDRDKDGTCWTSDAIEFEDLDVGKPAKLGDNWLYSGRNGNECFFERKDNDLFDDYLVTWPEESGLFGKVEEVNFALSMGNERGVTSITFTPIRTTIVPESADNY